MDKRLDAEGFDLFLGMDSQFLADIDFHGQPVRVPARLPFAVKAPHRLVAGEQIFDGAGEAVAWMGHPVRRGGTFVKDEFRPFRTLSQRLEINSAGFPKAE